MRLIIITLAALVSGCFIANAQDTVKRSQKINSRLSATYYVQKANKKIKEGIYTEVTGQNTVVATGGYKNDKRIGKWHFFTTTGKPTQVFDYDSGQAVATYATTDKAMQCVLGTTPAPTDTVKTPVAIGGIGYFKTRIGLDFGVLKALSEGIYNDTHMELHHVVTINDQGVVIKHVLIIGGGINGAEYLIDDGNDRNTVPQFVPATVNNKPVLCRVAFTTSLDVTLQGSAGLPQPSSFSGAVPVKR